MSDGKFTIESTDKLLAERQLKPKEKAQEYIDSEVLRLCDPKVPLQDGTLKQSGVINTKIGSGEVKYSTPYARRWYYMPANFTGAPERGNYWFERMKQDGGKEQILKGVKEITGGK